MLAALIALLFSYVAYRAYHLSFTHDESLSYEVVHGDDEQNMTANNHQLNTVLMYVCSSVLGDWEWSLRLPNVLAFLLYAFFVVKLLALSPLRWSSVLLGSVLLLAQPFFLDFFSLARGYGLALAFLMASYYYFIGCMTQSFTVKQQLAYSIGTVALVFTACMANLSTINLLIVVTGLLIVRFFYCFYRESIPIWRYVVAVVLGLVIIYIPLNRLLFLKHRNQLYYGAKTWADSYDSLIKSMLYGVDYSETVLMSLLGITVGIFILGLFTALAQRKLFTPLTVLLTTFCALVIGIELENKLFGALYPLDRTGLLLLLTWLLMAYYIVAAWASPLTTKLAKAVALVVAISCCLPLGYHFQQGANLTYFFLWDYDASTKDALTMIEADRTTATNTTLATISTRWFLVPTVNYYIKTRNITLQLADREGIRESTTYIYKDEYKGAEVEGYRILQVYPARQGTAPANPRHNKGNSQQVSLYQYQYQQFGHSTPKMYL